MNSMKYMLHVSLLLTGYTMFGMDTSSSSEEMELDRFQQRVIDNKDQRMFRDFNFAVNEAALTIPEMEKRIEFLQSAYSPDMHKIMMQDKENNKRAYTAAFGIAPNLSAQQRSPEKRHHSSPEKANKQFSTPKGKSVRRELFPAIGQ